MKTEINGDWKSYFLRFKLPSKEAFLFPLKPIFIAVSIQLPIVIFVLLVPITPLVAFLISFAVCMIIIGYYMHVLWPRFWNNILEESKGFFADAMMWGYYIILCTISILPSIFTMEYVLPK